MKKLPLILMIRFCGWGGAFLTLISVLTKSVLIFVISQLLGSTSAFLYNYFLIGKIPIDSWAALALSTGAVITGDFWLTVFATFLRTLNYQFVFERLVKERAIATRNDRS